MVGILKYSRIAICGTHSIGKTTISRYMAETFGYRLIREIARELLEEKGTDWRDLAHEQVVDFQKALFHTHKFLIGLQPRFISDRSLIDHLAYIRLHVDKGNGKIKGLFEEVTDWVSRNAKKAYDIHVYYSPLGFSLTAQQVEIDRYVRYYLDKYAPGYLIITRAEVNGFMSDLSGKELMG